VAVSPKVTCRSSPRRYATQWKSVKPHPAATEAQPIMSVIVRLAQKIRMEIGEPDIPGVLADVEQLLQESVGAVPLVIAGWKVVQVDLTRIDFEPLAALFAKGRATAVARRKVSLEQRLKRMVRLNPELVDYVDKLRDLIERHNSGSENIEEFFDELRKFADDLNEE
jgi:type I restriction enzyme R subunit